MDIVTAATPWLIYLGIGIVVLLLLRAVALWYWKVNRAIERLDTIADLLRRAPWNEEPTAIQADEHAWDNAPGRREMSIEPDPTDRPIR